MYRDGSLSSFPLSLDQFDIKWPIANDRIHGQNSERDDQEKAEHWNHMFDSCITLEKYMQRLASGGGIKVYTVSGTTLQGTDILLGYQQYTLPASGSQSSWEYTLQVPAAFGSYPFDDWRFGVSPTVYINVMPPNYLKPAGGGIGARADYDYIPEILSTYQPHCMLQPVSGNTFKLKIETVKMHPTSQLIGEIEENCTRPTPTEQLGSSWLRYGSYPALGIGNTNYDLGGAGNLLYMASEGTYGDNNSQYWQDNWGIAFPSTLGISNDQQVIFSPYTWKGDGVDVGDYMSRSLIGLRVSGDFGYTGGNLTMYAVVLGDEALSSSARPTTGRLVKIDNTYIFGWDYWDSGDLVSADPLTSITSLGTFPLSLVENDGLPNLRYRFRVQGTTLTVDKAEDGASYTNLLTVVDSDISQGTVGIFSTPLRGTGTNEKCRRLMYYNYLKFQVLSGESPCDLKISLLYSLVGSGIPATQTL